MVLYNFPEYRSPEFYEKVIHKVTNTLSQQNGIVSIYKLGGVNDPGISDLDMIAVFGEGVQNPPNPLDDLNKNEKYIFTHSVFGASENHLEAICSYNLLNNLQLLWGRDLLKPDLNSNIRNETLRRQIALEYIVNNIISRTVEKFYGLLSVRNILLSAKALAYDLDLLDCDKDEPLYQNINRLLSIRANWFETNNREELFLDWYNDFFECLHEYVKNVLRHNPLHLPADSELKIARNIKIVHGTEFSYHVRGFNLPPRISALHKKIRNANSLFSKFDFFIPFEKVNDPILVKRFQFISQVLKYNKKYLPNFSTFANSIALKTFQYYG